MLLYNAVDLVGAMAARLCGPTARSAGGSLRSRVVVGLALAEVAALWGTIAALLA